MVLAIRRTVFEHLAASTGEGRLCYSTVCIAAEITNLPLFGASKL